jgi:hypothetical protein
LLDGLGLVEQGGGILPGRRGLEDTGCDPDEVDLVGHSGSCNGHRILLAYHPASGTTLAFFANWDFSLREMLPGVSDLYEQLGLTYGQPKLERADTHHSPE